MLKKLVLNFFDKEKYVVHSWKLTGLLKALIEAKKIHRVLEFN